MKPHTVPTAQLTSWLGIASVALFGIALFIFGNLHPTFDFLQDFVSKLGALGEPNAVWWNIIGFVLVGCLLFGFGISYGNLLKDTTAGIFLALFGVGFAFTATPVDFAESEAPVSKAHIVAICLALACWLFALARISYKEELGKRVRFRANVAATLIVIGMMGSAIDAWPMPVTHRIVFLVVFGWTAITAVELLRLPPKKVE